jgi:hypothetical protein
MGFLRTDFAGATSDRSQAGAGKKSAGEDPHLEVLIVRRYFEFEIGYPVSEKAAFEKTEGSPKSTAAYVD